MMHMPNLSDVHYAPWASSPVKPHEAVRWGFVGDDIKHAAYAAVGEGYLIDDEQGWVACPGTIDDVKRACDLALEAAGASLS